MSGNSSRRQLVPLNIRDLSPYVAGKTIAEVEATYHPSRISKLASNENRLGCSPSVKPAVLKAVGIIQDYPDPISGKLRGMLADRLGVQPKNIVVGAGSESILATLCRTFFLNNEEAITADTTFVGFFVQINIRGIFLKKIPVTKDYRFDLDAMAEAVTARTKIIYIANPNNPTGTYIKKSEFEDFMEKIPSDVLVVMDEAYFEYSKEVEDYPNSLDYKFDNVLTLRTFSKAYGLAGLRIGYAIGHRELIRSMMKTKLTFEPAVLAQVAACAALEDETFLRKSIELIRKGKERLYTFFDNHHIQYVPSVANSILMILENEAEAINFMQTMVEKGVILRRTNAFGMPHGVRVTIGTELEIEHFEQSIEMIRTHK